MIDPIERAAYEYAYRGEVERRGNQFDSAVFARNGDEYVLGSVQVGWWAWQSRAALDTRPDLPDPAERLAMLETQITGLQEQLRAARDYRRDALCLVGFVRQQMRYWKPNGGVAVEVKADLIERIDAAMGAQNV